MFETCQKSLRLEFEQKLLLWDKQNLHIRRISSNLPWQTPTQLEVSTTPTVKQVPSNKKNDRCGRPIKTTESDERFIVRKANKNPFATCKQLQFDFNSFSTETTISAETTRRDLRRRKLIRRAAAKKILLRQKSRIERLKWCAVRKDLEVSDWKQYCCSDECRFKLRSFGRIWVWRTKFTTSKLPEVCPMIGAQCTLLLIKGSDHCNSRDCVNMSKRWFKFCQF